MANIQPEINAFKNAEYGEDVRDAMVSLAEKVNTESGKAATDAADVVTRANNGEFNGEKGDKGEKGATGATGPQGPQGLKGDTGAQGPRGATGLTGAQGATGPQGETGATFTPSVSSAGTISWTNDKGKTNPASVNIRGPQGIQGVKGDKGEKGDRGATGPQGEKGADGTSVNILGTKESESQLPNNANRGDAYLIGGYLWVYDGTSWINAGEIKGPKGDKGDKGDTGAQGPRGPQGPKGTDGVDGADGAQGPKGATGKSAYESAREGGYTATEAVFYADLAALQGIAAELEAV